MNKEKFLKLLEQSKEDDTGNLYIEGSYDSKIYFGLINTICYDFVNEYCYEDEKETCYKNRHFSNNDDTIIIDIIKENKYK